MIFSRISLDKIKVLKYIVIYLYGYMYKPIIWSVSWSAAMVPIKPVAKTDVIVLAPMRPIPETAANA